MRVRVGREQRPLGPLAVLVDVAEHELAVLDARRPPGPSRRSPARIGCEMPSRNPNGSRFESFAVVNDLTTWNPCASTSATRLSCHAPSAPWSAAYSSSSDVDRRRWSARPTPSGRDVGADVAEEPAAVVGHHAGQVSGSLNPSGSPVDSVSRLDPGRGERHVHGPVRRRLRRRRHTADVDESVDQVARAARARRSAAGGTPHEAAGRIRGPPDPGCRRASSWSFTGLRSAHRVTAAPARSAHSPRRAR